LSTCGGFWGIWRPLHKSIGAFTNAGETVGELCVGGLTGSSAWRRGWDSNHDTVTRTTVFEF
jgi:hypothetical protein